jgi:hypothetical protein
MTADASALFQEVALALAGAQPTTAPTEVLAVAGPYFDADRVWLVRFTPDHQVWWVAHEWCAAGVRAFLPELPSVPISVIAPAMVEFFRGRNVVYADVEKIPASGNVLKEEMRRQGNRATAAAPLFVGNRLEALIGVDDTRKTHPWTDAEMDRLKTVGEIVLKADAAREQFAYPPAGASSAKLGSENLADPASLPSDPEGCYLRLNNCHVKVSWSEILWLRAEGDYTRVRLASGQQFFERRTLAQWEVVLPRHSFGRVHRSWIVNWRDVHRLNREGGGRWNLELRHGEVQVPVSRAYQAIVRGRLDRAG